MIKKSKEKIDTKKTQIEISDLRKSLMNLKFQKASVLHGILSPGFKKHVF